MRDKIYSLEGGGGQVLSLLAVDAVCVIKGNEGSTEYVTLLLLEISAGWWPEPNWILLAGLGHLI